MKRAVAVFLTIAFALSIILSLVIGLTGGHNSPLIGLGYLSMFLPAVAVLTVSTAMGEHPEKSRNGLPFRYLPAALFLIPVVFHATMLPFMGVHWQAWLTPQADDLFHTPDSRGWGTLTLAGLVAHIALNIAVGGAIVSVLAFFEELGWRAWLLPRFADGVGSRRAVILTSLIWALWHMPFEISGIQHIDGVSPWKLALVLPFGIFATGLILGWLWLRTESIWIVSIAHGTANNWGQYAWKYMQDSGRPNHDLIALTAASAVLAGVGAWLVYAGVRQDGEGRLSAD